MIENAMFSLLGHYRYGITNLIYDCCNGDGAALMTLGIIVGCIAFFVIYAKVSGKSFVKSRKERRESRRRRNKVVWEYRRDED